MHERMLRGVGVSPGLAYAPALVLEWRFPNVPDRWVSEQEVEGEVRRLHEAVAAVVRSLDRLRERVLERAGLEESQIFEAQIMMAQDPDFLAEVEHLIRDNRFSAETAYEFKALEKRAAWSGTANTRLRERLADLLATQVRVLRHLIGDTGDELFSMREYRQVIIVAHELYPGLTVQLDRDQLVGLVSEEGTRTSHAAILAHSLGIPCVMGVPGAVARIKSGTLVLADGTTGNILLEPTMAELEAAQTTATRRHKLELELEANTLEPSSTPDGVRVVLMGNVDLPDEIDMAARHGAQGVGLLRTEFLIAGRAHLPSEEEQLQYFRRVGAAFRGAPVVIRTYDLGGDKFPAAFAAPSEANPFLGWRSIRVCLDQPEIFRPQLRAILRAGAERPIEMMLPLVTRVAEVERVREMLAEEAADLTRAGVRTAQSVPVGVMVETPAAVVIADRLARVSAFFSIGTNDLTQYTLAVDRGNAHLASRFTPHDPAVLRMLRDVLRAGEAQGIPVSVCGEMASEPLFAVLLIGLGFTTLSVAPPALPLLKWLVRTVPASVAREAARAALEASGADDVTTILREALEPIVDLRLIDPSSPLPGRGSGSSFTSNQ
ncbi:MAG TPA: phosphoenolpyruvate--protein phosphotransferase [Gemmatimonadales bacterium]|jgi:phosphotransferase system enzyme I (PtsI)|nr:phosphoenolpyruvate--protein phosphotransferase [Gemmatimonadales bacterium]